MEDAVEHASTTSTAKEANAFTMNVELQQKMLVIGVMSVHRTRLIMVVMVTLASKSIWATDVYSVIETVDRIVVQVEARRIALGIRSAR